MLLIGSSICKCDVRCMKKIAYCVLRIVVALKNRNANSRRAEFPPVTMNVFPGYFQRKIEPEEAPSCLIRGLLIVFTRHLEIVVTTLLTATLFCL